MKKITIGFMLVASIVAIQQPASAHSLHTCRGHEYTHTFHYQYKQQKQPQVVVEKETTPKATNQTQTETQTQAQTQSPAPVEKTNSAIGDFEQQVLTLTNEERQKNGLQPLAWDDQLAKSAEAKSQDMSNKHYFSHQSPTYGSPFDQMKQFGISYKAAAENIAMGQTTPDEVVKAWMNSPGHRQNILNASYTHIGIGYVANGNYWTQQFIQK